jgi:tetratricopeptide (TPR) repeat protein
MQVGMRFFANIDFQSYTSYSYSHTPMKRILLSVVLLLVSASGLLGRSQKVDSLWRAAHDPSQVDSLRINALILYGNEAYLASNPDSAIYFADLAFGYASALGLRRQQLKALNAKGMALSGMGKYREAIGYYEEGVKIGIESLDTIAVGVRLNNMAKCYIRLGEQEKAKDYLEAALRLWTDLGQTVYIGGTLNNLASIYENQGDYATAIDYYMKSLHLRMGLEDEAGAATCHSNIGRLYLNQGESAAAMRHLQAALEIRKELGDAKGQSNTLKLMAELQVKEGAYPEAIKRLHLAMEIDKSAEAADDVAAGQVMMSQALDLQGQTEEAEAYSDSALVNYRATENQVGLSQALIQSGTVRMHRGRLPAAVAALEEALDIAEKNRAAQEIRDAALGLYTAQKQMGADREALKMHELYMAMRDSLASDENRRASIRQELKYEQEMAQLVREQADREAARLAAEAISRRDRLQYSLVGGGVMAFLIALVVLGFVRVPEKLALAIVFLSLVVLFEFLLVLLDPYVDPITQGQPAPKFLINFCLALVLAPVHQLLERFVHRRLLRRGLHG